MTLREWSAKYGVEVSGPTTEKGACSIVYNFLLTKDHVKRWELFHLTDYKVSTVSGIVFWLLPVPSVVLDPEAGYKIVQRPRIHTGW